MCNGWFVGSSVCYLVNWGLLITGDTSQPGQESCALGIDWHRDGNRRETVVMASLDHILVLAHSEMENPRIWIWVSVK